MDSVIGTLVNGVALQGRPLPDPRTGDYEPAQNKDMGAFLSFSKEVLEQIDRGNPLPENPFTFLRGLANGVESSFSGEGIDDRLHAFEQVLDLLAKLDPEHAFVKRENNKAITALYDTLTHPPVAYVGEQHSFRQADGGMNNLYYPDIGRAGTPYARSVQTKTPSPAAELPDPELVFDVLLRRRYPLNNANNNHKNGNSALTFAFASIVTHSLFRTARRTPDKPWEDRSHINETSSYLDLSPLYGCNQAEQDEVRHKEGYGKLWPDVFSDDRLSHLPPAVSALLVIFNRNHNYICDMLLKINEKGLWKQPSTLNLEQIAIQDEQIFQTARLINCGHYMTMIFSDYVAGFLGQTRHGQSWHLAPFDTIKRNDGTPVGRGEGNHVSVEFNLIYRWHATTSLEDEEWTEQQFENVFGTREWEHINLQEFRVKAGGILNGESDAKKRTFAGLVRGEDGKFKDADIAKVLQDAIARPAQRFGARGTPNVLRHVEVATMLQARRWSVCTMNDFREFMGLKRFDSFEEWNSDPEIAQAARSLYKHIDRLELYPGIQAEENLAQTYGSGFMCGYTLMRAILADAICLVRGDRFYTTDFTPANLTTWGYQDCQPFLQNGAWGANLGRLFFRHLPTQFPYNSTYGLYPFFTPKAMNDFINVKKTVKVNGKLVHPEVEFTRPVGQQETAVVKTMKGVRAVFNDPENFKTTYTEKMNFLSRGYGFFLVFDERGIHDSDKHMCMQALWPDEETFRKYADFYSETTARLINERSFNFDTHEGPDPGPKYVDIVRQVINVTSVRWACDWLTGLNLKDKTNPNGVFAEQEVYKMLAVLFSCVFQNILPENGAFLRLTAKKVGDFMNGIIENSLRQMLPGVEGSVTRLKSRMLGKSIAGKPCEAFLDRLVATGKPIDTLVACVIGLTVGSSVNYAQASAHIIDFYLDDARKVERERIIQLVHEPPSNTSATAELVSYIKEAQRLLPQFPGLFRYNGSDKPVTIQEGPEAPGAEPKTVTINPGQEVFCSFYKAQTNPIDFPDPLTVRTDRPRGNYMVQGTGFHGCPGLHYAELTLAEVVRVVFKLKNVRRAPGNMGKLSSFMHELKGTPTRMYLDPDGKAFPWPGSLYIAYDP